MTRTLFISAGLLAITAVAVFIGGLTTANATLPMLAMLCLIPVFLLLIGAAIGRFTIEYEIAPRRSTRPEKIIKPAARSQELLS